MNTTQNVQAGVNTAVGNALHAANIQNIKTESKQLPMIVPRVDLLGNLILVNADSYNKEDDTVVYYDLKKGNKPSTVSAAYYKATKKIDDKAVIAKLVTDFCKATGNKEVILRERLLKESRVQRDENGNLNSDDLKAWKQKLVAAMTKVIMEA